MSKAPTNSSTKDENSNFSLQNKKKMRKIHQFVNFRLLPLMKEHTRHKGNENVTKMNVNMTVEWIESKCQ